MFSSRRLSVLFRLLAVPVSLFLTLRPAAANDSAVTGIGGTVRALPGEHATIQMVRETVRLDLYNDHYETTADFEFRNHGPATSVPMGFPERGSGDIGDYKKRSAYQKFVTTVDGRPVTATRRFSRQGDDREYLAYWTKTVPFETRQTRHVQVRYRSRYGTVSSGPLNAFVAYNFTGGNWKDKVLESRLVIRFHQPGTWAARGELYTRTGETGPCPLKQSGDTLTAVWTKWEAEGDFRLDLGTAPSGFIVPLGKDRRVLAGYYGNGPVLEVDNPGGAPTAYSFLPPLLRRDGRLYVRASDLERLLFPETTAGPRGQGEGVVVEFEAASRMAAVNVRDKRFPFTVPKGDAPRQPGDPFILSGYRNQSSLYVPLEPILTGLGARMVDDPSKGFSVLLPPLPGRSAKE